MARRLYDEMAFATGRRLSAVISALSWFCWSPPLAGRASRPRSGGGSSSCRQLRHSVQAQLM